MLLFESYLVMVIYLILSNQEIRNFGFNSIPVLGTSSGGKKKSGLDLSADFHINAHIFNILLLFLLEWAVGISNSKLTIWINYLSCLFRTSPLSERHHYNSSYFLNYTIMAPFISCSPISAHSQGITKFYLQWS